MRFYEFHILVNQLRHDYFENENSNYEDYKFAALDIARQIRDEVGGYTLTSDFNNPLLYVITKKEPFPIIDINGVFTNLEDIWYYLRQEDY
jgi:hypothetical protein